jgi:hypothetical protein
MAQPEPIDAAPDLTLSDAAARWGVSSSNTIKARAAALGVPLRRESSTRTVWPAADVALGDRLAAHLKQPGATLANFPEALPSVPSAGAGSGADGLLSVMAAGAGSGAPKPARRGGGALSVPSAGAGSDGAALAALAQLAAAINPAPPADPLAVARGLSDAAALGAWLTPTELARLLGVAPGTVRSWSTGHRPRPGFELERRKDGASVWWRVSASTD